MNDLLKTFILKCNRDRTPLQSEWHESEWLNPLSANPTNWSNTLKQIVGKSRQIVLVYLTILWGWHLKG